MKLQYTNAASILPKHIDIETTKTRFGYDPQFFKESSERIVVCICSICSREQEKKRRLALKTSICKWCANKNRAVKTRNKRSLSMKEYYKHNMHPMLGKNHTENTKQKIRKGREGKYQGKNAGGYGKRAKHGLGKYYKTVSGQDIWMRSSWEVLVAEYLDGKDIEWKYEYKAFPITYTYNNSFKEGTFRPDFYLINTNEYWEIKGYWRDDAKEKYTAFISQYPEINIILLMKEELKSRGIMVR